MNKFEELLEKYGVTSEDVTFEVEGLSDEELEKMFEETFASDPTDDGAKIDSDAGTDGTFTDDGASDNGSVGSDDITFESKKTHSVDDHGNVTVSFEISHEDIRGALFNLIAVYEEEDNEWYWVSNVYDSYFIFENWYGDKLYKQSYEVDGDNVSLSGDRQEMFKMILTESEKLAIEKMREDYAALESKYNELKTFKDQYDAAQIKAEKDAVLCSAEYAEVKDTEEFKTLVDDAEKYTIDEIKVKADLIFAASMKKKLSFEAETSDGKRSVSMNLNAKPNKKKQAYAGLFDQD